MNLRNIGMMEVVILIVAILIFTLVISGSIRSGNERDDLISQCMQDGKKEYECRAIFEYNCQL